MNHQELETENDTFEQIIAKIKKGMGKTLLSILKPFRVFWHAVFLTGPLLHCTTTLVASFPAAATAEHLAAKGKDFSLGGGGNQKQSEY